MFIEGCDVMCSYRDVTVMLTEGCDVMFIEGCDVMFIEGYDVICSWRGVM